MVCINMSKEVGVLFHSDLQFVFCLPCIISSGSLMKWTNCLNSAEAVRIRLEKKYLFDKNEIGDRCHPFIACWFTVYAYYNFEGNVLVSTHSNF
jgi:hypothetical protein